VLAVTKSDLLDEELIQMLRDTLPTDLPCVFISSITGEGLDELKDVLWRELNSESNKLEEITSETTLVHRDKDVLTFRDEMNAEGEDEETEENTASSRKKGKDEVEDLTDFEYTDD
jgi:GTP-binding protein